jgi:hypothetical protein
VYVGTKNNRRQGCGVGTKNSRRPNKAIACNTVILLFRNDNVIPQADSFIYEWRHHL